MGIQHLLLYIDKDDSLKGRVFSGTVLSNEDPEKKGRIRVMVKSLFDGIDKEELPWISPMICLFKSIQTFFVPKKDDLVSVIFPTNYPYIGFFLPTVVSEKSSLSDFNGEGYPDIYGIVDEKGFKFLVNRETGEIMVRQKDTNYFHLNEDMELEALVQDVKLNIDKESNVNLEGINALNVEQKCGNSLVITDEGELTAKIKDVDIEIDSESNLTASNVKNLTINCTEDILLNAQGNVNVQSQGNINASCVGDLTVSAANIGISARQGELVKVNSYVGMEITSTQDITMQANKIYHN